MHGKKIIHTPNESYESLSFTNIEAENLYLGIHSSWLNLKMF